MGFVTSSVFSQNCCTFMILPSQILKLGVDRLVLNFVIPQPWHAFLTNILDPSLLRTVLICISYLQLSIWLDYDTLGRVVKYLSGFVWGIRMSHQELSLACDSFISTAFFPIFYFPTFMKWAVLLHYAFHQDTYALQPTSHVLKFLILWVK